MRHKVQTFLTESEIKDILRQPDRRTFLGKRDFAILLLMLSTGIRRNELCSLNRDDLKVEGKKVWLYVWGKGGRQRRIPVKDLELLECLKEFVALTNPRNIPDKPLFVSESKQGGLGIRRVTWKMVRWLVEKYARQAKIPKKIHPHSLRHTFITHALRKSGDLPAVQKLAGHSDIKTTQIYLHTDEDRMEKVISSL